MNLGHLLINKAKENKCKNKLKIVDDVKKDIKLGL